MQILTSKEGKRPTVSTQFREAWHRYLAIKRPCREQEKAFEHYLDRLTDGFVKRERMKTS